MHYPNIWRTHLGDRKWERPPKFIKNKLTQRPLRFANSLRTQSLSRTKPHKCTTQKKTVTSWDNFFQSTCLQCGIFFSLSFILWFFLFAMLVRLYALNCCWVRHGGKNTERKKWICLLNLFGASGKEKEMVTLRYKTEEILTIYGHIRYNQGLSNTVCLSIW